jgi:hypothetical protein
VIVWLFAAMFAAMCVENLRLAYAPAEIEPSQT